MREPDMPDMRLLDADTLGDVLTSMSRRRNFRVGAVVQDLNTMLSMRRALNDSLQNEISSGSWQLCEYYDERGWFSDNLTCGENVLSIYTPCTYRPDNFELVLYGDGLLETVQQAHGMEIDYDTDAMREYIDSMTEIKPSFYTQNSTADAVENT